MRSDIRDTPLYRRAETIYTDVRRPGTGAVSDVAELHVSADAKHCVFAGSIVETMNGVPRPASASSISNGTTYGCSRAVRVRIDRLVFRRITLGWRFFPIASRPGNFHLYLLNRVDGELLAAPRRRAGSVSAMGSDGSQILLGVAGYGADLAETGRCRKVNSVACTPSWVPDFDTGSESYRWRSVSGSMTSPLTKVEARLE